MITSCRYCNIQFQKNRKDKVFCSRKCKVKYKNKKKGRDKLHNNRGTRGKTLLLINIKSSFCSNCGFIAIHPCQLDIDHIDGNHLNNSLSNLQTLCANCHRLKTYINKDWKGR